MTKIRIGIGIRDDGRFPRKRVIMVQFLKGMLGEGAADVLKRLEPDLKFFRFEHSKERFEDFRKIRSTRN